MTAQDKGNEVQPKRRMTDVAQLQLQSQRMLRKLGRSFKATWKLYKNSKTGLAGLAIVIGFFVMAIFADWISPYSATFKAPGVDIFLADSVEVDIQDELNWSTPIGLLTLPPDSTLNRVLLYSKEGVAKVYPISRPSGETEGIVVEPVQTYPNFPENVSYVKHVHFTTTFFFLLEGRALHEFTNNLIDTTVEYDIGFEPKYKSNLWNGYTPQINQARMALVFADDHELWLIDKKPPNNVIDFTTRTYVDNITIHDATILGNPLVVDGDFSDGSWVIVPTDKGIMGYRLNVTRGVVTGFVSDVKFGDRIWVANYTVDDEEFEPVVSDNMITFPYPYGGAQDFGKEHVLVGTTDGHIAAFYRTNGTMVFYTKLVMPTIRDFEIDALYPAVNSVLVTGRTGERSFIAGVYQYTGLVRHNQTMYSSYEGYLTSPPQFAPGPRMYVFSTTAGGIYLIDELLKVNATFSAPSGGMATPVSYLGSIYISSIVAGNYFGILTQENTLFVETLSGINIAPLPPGTYPSGNHYILGTDYEGHDILAWVIYGTRAELMVGVTAAFFSVVIGTIVGLIAGYYGGRIDDLLMRSTDVVLSLPYLVIMLLFAAVFGPSLWNIIIIIAVLSWAGIARVIRSVTLSMKERSFVDAAIIAGASQSRLIFKHIAPNVLPYTFLYMTFGISGAIVTEAILAFLGFGDVNYVTWGMMLQYLQISGHSLDAPWWLLPPGICITLLSLAFYLIGRAFDEVVNPRLRKR